jgi:hypothetical protein
MDQEQVTGCARKLFSGIRDPPDGFRTVVGHQ